MVEIIKKYDKNIIHFSLNSNTSINKPGQLVDLTLSRICKKLNIYFDLTKCFYINELNSHESRGNHSNNNASEILFCLQGTFELKLNSGNKSIHIHLKKNEAVFINKNIWIEFFNFENCVVLAFVDIDYDEEKKSCYDFEEFIKMNKN
jgi:mannose-6-phosphate isomerase-like protein (cupin superfamily)